MKPKFWFVIAGMAAVLALIIALVTIFSTGTGPRGYVANHYTRAAQLDKPGDDDNKAYTSSRKPSEVANAVARRGHRSRSTRTTPASTCATGTTPS